MMYPKAHLHWSEVDKIASKTYVKLDFSGLLNQRTFKPAKLIWMLDKCISLHCHKLHCSAVAKAASLKQLQPVLLAEDGEEKAGFHCHTCFQLGEQISSTPFSHSNCFPRKISRIHFFLYINGNFIMFLLTMHASGKRLSSEVCKDVLIM